jgi:hypothetical protein
MNKSGIRRILDSSGEHSYCEGNEMTPRNRKILIAAGSVIAVILLVITCIPLFLNADSFRTRIESNLSNSLGRQVTMGKLGLSVWSGSLVAENTSIAEDPAFGTHPFLQAESVKINVELLPLIFGQKLHIQGFSIRSPKIRLLRNASGVWNYSTIGSAAAKSAEKQKDTNDMIPGLTVGHVDVNNGQLTVGSLPSSGAASTPDRTYDKLDLEAKGFSFAKQFPYSASASLPAGGSVSINGNAGPVNPRDASLTPFSAHIELKHLDPLAAGFVDATAGIGGTIDSIVADALWNGQQLHVTDLTIDTPRLTLTSGAAPARPAPQPAAANSMLNNFALDKLVVKNGAIATAQPGKQPAGFTYQQINATLTNFSSKSSAPFTLTAQIPGGGSVNATGHAGPLNQQTASATPFDAQVSMKHVDLASSGLLAPDAGIGGIASFDAKAVSNGQALTAAGTAHVDGIRLAKDGSPSSTPVNATFNLSQNLAARTGTIQNAAVNIGAIPINIGGTYQTTGPATTLNLRVNTQAASIDGLQAFLPALGVHLPTGSRLQGGTLTATLAVTGSSASPVISGPVALDNTQLSGFDLGSKLSALSAFTGGSSRTGSATAIKSLRMNIRVAGGDIRTDNVALVMPALGSATGNGTVSAAGALNYQMVLKLTALSGGGGSSAASSSAGGIAGQLMAVIPSGASSSAGIGGITGAALKNGIPVAIGGTTSNPTFTPDVASLAASGVTQGLLNGKKQQSPTQNNPLGNALGGFLKPKN